MRRMVVIAGALLILSGWPMRAAALDPLSLIVLRALRDHLASSTLEHALTPEARPPMLGYAPPPVRTPSAGELRDMIAAGFPNLNAAQREAVVDRLGQILADPRYAAQRQRIVQAFTDTAAAMRDINERLQKLSARQKKAIAAQIADAYRSKPPAEVQELLGLLHAPAVPIPSDLRDMMLAELSTLATPNPSSR